MVDDLMQENPQIDYIKWDANMSIDNHGSQYLAPDRQSHLYIEYHRGFADVLLTPERQGGVLLVEDRDLL